MDIIKQVEASSALIFEAFMPFSLVSGVQCPEIHLAHGQHYETTSARLFFAVVKLLA